MRTLVVKKVAGRERRLDAMESAKILVALDGLAKTGGKYTLAEIDAKLADLAPGKQVCEGTFYGWLKQVGLRTARPQRDRTEATAAMRHARKALTHERISALEKNVAGLKLLLQELLEATRAAQNGEKILAGSGN